MMTAQGHRHPQEWSLRGPADRHGERTHSKHTPRQRRMLFRPIRRRLCHNAMPLHRPTERPAECMALLLLLHMFRSPPLPLIPSQRLSRRQFQTQATQPIPSGRRHPQYQCKTLGKEVISNASPAAGDLRHQHSHHDRLGDRHIDPHCPPRVLYQTGASRRTPRRRLRPLRRR